MDTNVVLFPRQPVRSPTARIVGSGTVGFKLFAADKIDLCRWETEAAGAAFARIAVHEGSGLSEEDADVALLYTLDGPWACWGLARCGEEVLLWRCKDGQDIGRFSSVREALAAVSFATLNRLPSPRLQRVTA